MASEEKRGEEGGAAAAATAEVFVPSDRRRVDVALR